MSKHRYSCIQDSSFLGCWNCGYEFTEWNQSLGSHEPIITMKDNNMTSKIRLYPEHAYSVIETLNADSDALCGECSRIATSFTCLSRTQLQSLAPY